MIEKAAPSLYKAINEYVEESLKGLPLKKVPRSKVIHDSIHGTNAFSPVEISILDLPLIQRLRRISQVDLVSLVFPSGNHNRFEHSIGVAVVADKLARTIAKEMHSLDKSIILEARLAGILHDCGHGPLSHLSEDVYRDLAEFPIIRQLPQYEGRKPHEILSHLIICSEPFRKYITELQDLYGLKINLDRIAAMIIGDFTEDCPKYISGIINGPFDADKLDYIQRDSHFTGIKIVLDIDRLFYTVRVTEKEELCINLSGVSTLEQIMFDKMMLASTVYHHHKVRAAEALIKATFEIIIERSILVKGRVLQSAADFLYLSDQDILGLETEDHDVQRCINRIKNRQLYKRALVISKKTVLSEYAENISELTRLGMKNTDRKILRTAIYELVKNKCKCNLADIWVDLPVTPTFGEGSKCIVQIPGDQEYELLRNIFPTDKWVTAFSEYKWQGYVFCPEEIRKIVHEAAKRVFEDAFGIRFNKYAEILCKMGGDN